MSLEKAAPEVQLAVDLIYLLESNDLGPEVVLAALEIVKTTMKLNYRAKTPDNFATQQRIASRVIS